ncbi:hypothetical protein ACTPD5_22200, partial [Clostridioides difficile]|uniref:hypothetical protein n=1 Tax=Clostridioides difficile TaxID=1496 RepID=UPI003F8D45FA
NLKDYNVTQECIIEDITSRKDVNKYLRKTSAPITELTGSDRYLHCYQVLVLTKMHEEQL